MKQKTLARNTKGGFVTELLRQDIEEANNSAYEEVRALLEAQREAIKQGEDPSKIREEYEKEWSTSPKVTHEKMKDSLGELKAKLIQCSNLRTEKGKAQALYYFMRFLKLGEPKTVAEVSQETTIHRTTINRWAKDLENMNILRRDKGVLILLLDNPVMFDGTQNVGIHHIMGNLATEKGVDGITLNLRETCCNIMKTSHFFIGHPDREIYQHPRREVPTRSTSFFVKASDDQIPIGMFDQFWDELERYFRMSFTIHDFDLAFDLHHKKINLRFKNLTYDRKDVHRLAKFYLTAEKIQRIDVAGIGKVIESPEEAVLYAQVLDFRCDMAEQIIDLNRTIKRENEKVKELTEENLQLKTQLDVFTSKTLMDAFRVT